MLVFVTKKGQAGSLCDNNQLKVQEDCRTESTSTVFAERENGRGWPGDGVERLMGKSG